MKISSKIRVGLIASVLCAYVAPSALAQASSDSGNANEQAYHVLLQKIADEKIRIGRKQVFVAGAEAQIANLNSQIDGLGDVKTSVGPMIDKMVAGISREIEADFPFKKDERYKRLNKLKDTLASAASPGEKYRSALNIYKIEVNYGQSLEAYKGDHPVSTEFRKGDDRFEKNEDGSIKVNKKTGERVLIFDGNYLRYGRVAYVYLNADGTDPLRYDLSVREWVPMKGAEADIRRAIRISYGEVAPGVVVAPVVEMP